MNFLLAKYIAYAFNDVKHFPKKPFLYEEQRPADMTDDDMERMAKYNVIKLGGEIKQ